MRVGVYNPFYGDETAELEIIRRIQIAGPRIGLAVEEVGCLKQALSVGADFILSMHHTTPKLCGIPTYGCMWNPPVFVNSNPDFVRNVMSLDGFLSSGPLIDRWIRDSLYASEKDYFITPFYASCFATEYQPLEFGDPRLLYCGINWDGSRHAGLFECLDRRDYMAVYGPKDRWGHIRNSYRGTIPFDGRTVLARLREAGAGLCMHKDEHVETGIPSMRIFEIAAAGAVAICRNHSFIRDVFGDSVLYIEDRGSAEQKAQQIDEHMAFIRKNPDRAREMTARAHRIFLENYTLEKLLQGVVTSHEKLVSRKFSPISVHEDGGRGLVQVIMRVGSRPVQMVERALESLMRQTYPHFEVIIVRYREVPGLDELISRIRGKIGVRLVTSRKTKFRSTALWDGLKELTGEYFAILDDDDELFPNHLATLVKILNRHGEVNLAYSGSVRVLESDRSGRKREGNFVGEEAELAFFQPFETLRLLRFENFITSNAWVGRTAAIEPWMLRDPELFVNEDLFLIMCLLVTSRFIFSYEATCCFYWRKSKRDNATFLDHNVWLDDIERIKTLLRAQGFWEKVPCTVSLEAALAWQEHTVRLMRSSYSWRLTRPLRALGAFLLSCRQRFCRKPE